MVTVHLAEWKMLIFQLHSIMRCIANKAPPPYPLKTKNTNVYFWFFSCDHSYILTYEQNQASCLTSTKSNCESCVKKYTFLQVVFLWIA